MLCDCEGQLCRRSEINSRRFRGQFIPARVPVLLISDHSCDFSVRLLSGCLVLDQCRDVRRKTHRVLSVKHMTVMRMCLSRSRHTRERLFPGRQGLIDLHVVYEEARACTLKNVCLRSKVHLSCAWTGCVYQNEVVNIIGENVGAYGSVLATEGSWEDRKGMMGNGLYLWSPSSVWPYATETFIRRFPSDPLIRPLSVCLRNEVGSSASTKSLWNILNFEIFCNIFR